MAGHRRPLCSATTTKGAPCRARAIDGGTVCRYHGGSAPQVAAAAAQRAALAEAARIAERLGVITDPENPFEAALVAVRQLRFLAQELGGQVFALVASGGLRYEHEKSGEQIRGEVTVYQKVLKDLGDLALAIGRAGLEEKLAEVNERQGQVVVSFVVAALEHFGINFRDPENSKIVMTLFDSVVRGDGTGVPPPAVAVTGPPEITYVCEHGMHEKCQAHRGNTNAPEPRWLCPCECHFRTPLAVIPGDMPLN